MLLLVSTQTVLANAAPPGFTKTFTPDTIGPGSVSTLVFTIDNTAHGAPISDLAFTDTLPAGVTIADPANASTTCDLQTGGSLSAPDGGSTITFSGHRIEASSACTVSVDVTSSSIGTHMNVSSILTNDFLDSTSPATDDLNVVTDRPGISKSFAPISVSQGGRSTLTITIDNSANASALSSLVISDNLPLGMEIASPANASTTCGGPNPTFTAVAGTSLVSFQSFGLLFPGFEVILAGETCTIVVDVIATGAGELDNVTGELTSNVGSSGKASATLISTRTDLAISKSFLEDPVPAGGSVDLEFTLSNFDRNSTATDVAFTDDLTTLVPSLTGLTFASLTQNSCGGSVSGAGTSTIGFSGGSIASQASCTIGVTLSVPLGTTPGGYVNTTSTISAMVDGSPVVGNTAVETLFVSPAPAFTKTFLDDPINPGETTVLEFTITNTSTTSSATDIAFVDQFDPVLFKTASVLPGNDCCGDGSICTFSPFINPGSDSNVIPAQLAVTGGFLAPVGMAGDSCTFTITLDSDIQAGPGEYDNVTNEITATVDGATRTGKPATDTITVVSAPSLTKSFNPAVASSGDTVTLEFSLEHSENAAGPATAISFTDDLAAALAGLSANGLPLMNVCDPDGPGGDPGTGTLSGSAGDTLLTFSGGTLDPGEQCAFTVDLTVPAAAPTGTITNTTSGISAMESGVPVTAAPATADLLVTSLLFSQEFIGDPIFPGENVTLRFTLENNDATNDATSISFSNDLALLLPGVPDVTLVTSLPLSACGGTLSTLGGVFLFFSGGSVLSGDPPCTFDLTLNVPASTGDGTYTNATGTLTALIGGSLAVLGQSTGELVVDSSRLAITKSFTDDPVVPGDPVTLEFTLTNLDTVNAASAVSFSDNLGAALSGLTFDSVLFNDCSATVSGTGTDMIMASGASLAAGASCTIRTSLTVPAGADGGTYTNTTSAISGTINGFPASGEASSDDLTVAGFDVDFSKSFSGPVQAGGTVQLTFTITNAGTDAVANLSFTDDLDAVISGMLATNLPLNDVCGPGSEISGTSFLTFSGGNLPPTGGMCSFDVTLSVPISAAPGSFLNTTGELFSLGLEAAEPATANLTVLPTPPAFTKSFSPGTLSDSNTSTLSFTIDNSNSGADLSNLSFTDDLDAALSGMVATGLPMTDVCGTGSMLSGTSVLTLTGGDTGPNNSCSFDVTVQVPASSAPDTYNNTTSSLTNDGLVVAAPAEADLIIDPDTPLFQKTFTPDSVPTDEISVLQFTIDNTTSAFDASSLDFTDSFPAGLVVADPSNVFSTCSGGTITAVPGTSTLSLTGATVHSSATCTISVDVTSAIGGMLVNLTGDLTSSAGNSGTATDTLYVDDDVDDDSVLNNVDNCPNTPNTDQADLDLDGQGNACDEDDDGDGMPDDYEIANGLDPLNSFDQLADNDGDGFTNLAEFLFRTDPNTPNVDLDGNGIPDIEDMRRRLAPLPSIYLLLEEDD